MADNLADETRDALLSSIKASAEKTTVASQLQLLGVAYAMTMGASRNKLPGYVPPAS